MAKKTSSSAAAKKTSTAKTTTPAVSVTPVRNTTVPPKGVAAIATPFASPMASPARKAVPTHDDIRVCATTSGAPAAAANLRIGSVPNGN